MAEDDSDELVKYLQTCKGDFRRKNSELESHLPKFKEIVGRDLEQAQLHTILDLSNDVEAEIEELKSSVLSLASATKGFLQHNLDGGSDHSSPLTDLPATPDLEPYSPILQEPPDTSENDDNRSFPETQAHLDSADIHSLGPSLVDRDAATTQSALSEPVANEAKEPIEDNC